MKKLIILLTIMLSTLTSLGQTFQGEDYYYRDFVEEQYKAERERMVMTLVGGIVFSGLTVRDYQRYGNQNMFGISLGMTTTVSVYSIYKLVKLRKEYKKWQKKEMG